MVSFRHRVRVQSLGVVVDASSTDTLLDALLDAGVDYPHGCTSGVCGLCKSRLVSGRVELADYCPALSSAEREAGMTLPCCAAPLADCVITPVHDMLLPKVTSVETEVAELRTLTHDIELVRLRLPNGVRFEFLPGQYASLDFAGFPLRDFSMASRPGDATLDFFIRHVPQGLVTTFVCERLRVGDPVRVKGPYGVAYLREAHLGPILLVAGGSGLAPILSIAATALQRGLRQEMRVYLGVRAPRDLYMEEELGALAAMHPKLSVEFAFSEAEPRLRRGGHLHEIIGEDLAGHDLREWRAYVAGPPGMVDAVAGVLSLLGLPDHNCHTDPFHTAADRNVRAGGTASPDMRAS